jgi:hypothetical protein
VGLKNIASDPILDKFRRYSKFWAARFPVVLTVLSTFLLFNGLPERNLFKVTTNLKSLAFNLGSGLAIDPVHYLQRLGEYRPLPQWSCKHWSDFFSSPKSERFLAILFALRNQLRDLPLLLFFDDFFGDWEDSFGEGLYPISLGSPCADIMARRRSSWKGAISDTLGSKQSVCAEALQVIAELKLDLHSDYVDFYDPPGLVRGESGVEFNRLKEDELDRLQVELLFREYFPGNAMRFYPVQTALKQFGDRDQGWWVYQNPKLRNPGDYLPLRTSDLFKLDGPGRWCSPLADKMINGDGVWKTLISIGHLSWLVLHDPDGGRDSVRMRVSGLDDYRLGLVSPVLVLKMFQPFGEDGSYLICDATRREPLVTEHPWLRTESRLCRNAITLFLHAYGADIDRVNEEIKANSLQEERGI